jgi:hypothetical protein
MSVRLAKVRQLWGKRSPREIAEELGVSERSIQRYAKRLGLSKYKPPTVGDHVRELRRTQNEKRQKKTNKELLRRIDGLEKELEASKHVNSSRNYYKIKDVLIDGSEAVAVAIASDWHVEEVVKAWQVNGLNKFNEKICQERVARFFRHVVKLLKHSQDHTKISTMVLALLGDFISGSIHDELMESNRLLPIDAIIECQTHISSGIRYILKHTDVQLVIPCHSGNHGRMTKGRRVSTEAGNSLEKLMYHALAKEFESDPRVEFIISDGYHSYVDVWDNFTIRFHHGHSIRYYGGIGGLSIPMNKAVSQWNKLRHVQLDVIGHFHQFMDGGNWIVNGSLVGYSAYALSIKAGFEPPQQAFFLIDKSAGKTVVAPIILKEDR